MKNTQSISNNRIMGFNFEDAEIIVYRFSKSGRSNSIIVRLNPWADNLFPKYSIIIKSMIFQVPSIEYPISMIGVFNDWFRKSNSS